MFNFFLPNYSFEKITDIDLNFFSGTKLIIFDIDNTLVFSETAETRKDIITWFHNIKTRYNCVCFSNSRTIAKRKDKISKIFGCDVFVSQHKKPFKKLFKEFKKKYNLGNSKIFIIGDRIFTDILFGNLNGAKTVLIKPLSDKENILIKILRKIENMMLFIINLLGYN